MVDSQEAFSGRSLRRKAERPQRSERGLPRDGELLPVIAHAQPRAGQLRGRDFVVRMKRPIGSSFGCTMGRRAGTISRYASRAPFLIGDDVWKTHLNQCPTSAVAHNTTSREGQLLARSGRSQECPLLG